jgi:hypothetical protein
MASFPNLQYCKPSAYAEGFGTFGISPSSAALLHAAPRTAVAPSELAALQGNHAVRTTLEHPTRDTSLVGIPAQTEVVA